MFNERVIILEAVPRPRGSYSLPSSWEVYLPVGTVGTVYPLCLLLLWQIGTDVFPEMGQFAHHAAADGSIPGFADEQQGLDAGEHTVDVGNVALVFKVDGIAHTTDEELCPYRLCKVGSESLVTYDMDAGLVFIECLDALHALLQGEHRLFPGVDADGNVKLVHHIQCTAYQGIVADGEGIERSGQKSGTSCEL